MSRILKVATLGLIIATAVLVFGSKDGAKAAAQALNAHGSSAAQRTIYPAGGSDGPPTR